MHDRARRRPRPELRAPAGSRRGRTRSRGTRSSGSPAFARRRARCGGRPRALRLARLAAVPDRADGVDDPARGQPVALRRLGLARSAASERAALVEQLRARRAMDGAVDAAAAQQRRVRGVDDRVDALLGDVAADDLDHASTMTEGATRRFHAPLSIPTAARSGRSTACLRATGFEPASSSLRTSYATPFHRALNGA